MFTSSLSSNLFSSHGLQLNANKSEILLVGTQEKRNALGSLVSSGLTIAGSSIGFSSSSKILGITFDSALNFDAHISEICKSANFHLKALASCFLGSYLLYTGILPFPGALSCSLPPLSGCFIKYGLPINFDCIVLYCIVKLVIHVYLYADPLI